MKKETLTQMLTRMFSLSTVISICLFASCSDDPEATNEEEVITTVIVTLQPAEGETVTLTWDDTNLDAVVDESEIVVSKSLISSTAYGATIQLLNKSADPVTDITEEVKDEDEDHIFCFTVTTVGIAITNLSKDSNELPVGITSTWTTSAPSTSGTVTITLRHQPGVKTGDCPGAGDTDASITFPISVGIPV
ncbi:MAG: type 1 periplasmic binding fold superfamily protein [Cyclobacteriaceae bacterium]|nr:MAG: type 1 periplasmic binding fold superfamily protein [Cyclobacteriaceae bacterium]